MEEIISEKKEREEGSSSCSNSTAVLADHFPVKLPICTQLTLGVLVAQRFLPHICKLDRAFARSVHEPVAAGGMELCSGDDLCQLLHVRRLDVYYVETLILNV